MIINSDFFPILGGDIKWLKSESEVQINKLLS